ncbi:MAG TPA: hypothetical protein VKF62_12975 [Planctomycetota bacterium]|nr:hypothetical protein [Planctomycetota bacterium]
MKAVVSNLLLAAAVSVLVSVLLAPAPPRPASAPDRAATESARASIQDLETSLGRLRAELEELRSMPGPAPSPSGSASRCDPHCEMLHREVARLWERLGGAEEVSVSGHRIVNVKLSDLVLADVSEKRPWGPEQATGQPDTPTAGDHASAWASLTPDGGNEWLLLEFPEAAQPSGVRVHESYNPGAVTQASVLHADGREEFVWAGADPTPPGAGQGVSWIPFRTQGKTRKVKLYLNSAGVPGWNEIDAVGLVDVAGRLQWASAASASSSYASRAEGTTDESARGPVPRWPR